MSTRIAILASGEGTNAQALLDASREETLGGGEVVVVVSDRHNARALRRAEDAGVEALFIDPTPHGTRADYSEALVQALQEREIDLVCLAGFMRILSPNFIKAFENRVLNIHPALLPAFAGANAVKEALDWGVKVTGTTVHFAEEEVDNGRVILQQAVPVHPDDDEETLHQRIKEVEHHLYPDAIWLLCSGKLRVEGRKVLITGDSARPARRPKK